MSSEQEFYRQRDRRTLELGAEAAALRAPVAIRATASTAASAAGQMLLLALVNMAARVHRRIVIDLPDAELVAPTLVASSTLIEAISNTVMAIDPFCQLRIGSPSGDEAVVIGIGEDANECHWYLGAAGYQATIANRPVALVDEPSTIWGAGLAACLGAAATYFAVHGRSPQPLQLSLWDLTNGRDAPIGPLAARPVDVGTVAMVGAGAVGSAVCYWLANIGVIGNWHVIDHDVVKLHNTNRSLAFLAEHAGWPDHSPAQKASVAAALVGGTAHPTTYAEWAALKSTPDLVLPLANEHRVRHQIGQRGEPILLHATTSRSTTAELHRHRPDLDQCIACRFPDDRPPDLSCSTGPALDTTDGSSTDAALPFLSAAAGLLLARALDQLPDGPLLTTRPNHWRLHFEPGAQPIQSPRWSCTASCASTVPAYARRAGHAGRRCSNLDTAAE
jgi:hypothetical protein